ncbi:hypothetical protein ACOSP7_020663 [Xanthoceras sorbifolium]
MELRSRWSKLRSRRRIRRRRGFNPRTSTATRKKQFGYKFSYKKQLIYEGQFASCCKSYPISCWQHCIEN